MEAFKLKDPGLNSFGQFWGEKSNENKQLAEIIKRFEIAKKGKFKDVNTTMLIDDANDVIALITKAIKQG